MTPLRARMIHEMRLHRLSPGTQDNYVRAIEGLARFHRRSPDRLTSDQLRAYLHHLLVKCKLAWSTCNVVAAAMRFFYVETLGWTPMQLNLPPRPAPKRLPQVLSVKQLETLFAHTRNPKHHTLLMTTYSAGLWVSEVVRLQVRDIESDIEYSLFHRRLRFARDYVV